MPSSTPSPDELLAGVPRGLASKFLKDQTPPQARWMDPTQLAAYKQAHYDPDNPKGKILVGAIGDQLIGLEDNRHVLTVAGSRAGKSVGLVSNLLFYDGSVLCTDPKGELAALTAARRAALGQKVYVLDPFEVVQNDAAKFRSAFNPLRILTLDNPYIIEDAAQIADALVVESGQEKDPHWNEEGRGFIGGLILFVAACDEFKAEDRHLGTVKKLLDTALAIETLDDGSQRYSVAYKVFTSTKRLAESGHPAVAAAIEGDIGGFYDKQATERAGVLSTARRHTRFLGYKAMSSVLTGHGFDLADLKRDPAGVTIYLCLPATRMGVCNRWLRIFINQLMDAMERDRTKLQVPVLLALDEFPVLGFMRQLQDAAGQIASFGVKLWVIMQDWGQGTALYGDRFESFAANAGIFQAFGNVDVATTEYIAKRLGQTLVETSHLGEASMDQREKGLSGKTVTTALYDLLTPDEIARLFARSDPLKRELVIWAGLHPMILQRVEYYDQESAYAHIFNYRNYSIRDS